MDLKDSLQKNGGNSGNKIAIIDIGSNSTRLLITHIYNIFSPIAEIVRVTRLSESAFKDKILKPLPMKRTLNTIKEYIKFSKKYTKNIHIFGTNILREAKNKNIFKTKIKDLGFELDIISGKDEAYFNFIAIDKYFKDKKKWLAFDLGGGSMEIIQKPYEKLYSLPIGCVRFMKEFNNKNYEFIKSQINDSFKDINIKSTYQEVIGVGGTATLIANIDLNLNKFDPKIVQGHKISYKKLLEMFETFSKFTKEELKNIKGMDKDRIDTFLPGLFIILNTLKLLKSEYMIASHMDLLYGYAIKKSLLSSPY